MFGFQPSTKANDSATLAALSRSWAMIEFDPMGKVLAANENFCAATGYQASEVVGQHHSLFVAPALAGGADYRDFWAKLARGEFAAGEFARVGKGGRVVWLQASYNPVTNARGKVVKVVKIASDITIEKLRTSEFESKMKAVSLAQAVIEFTPDGDVITANENFLKVIGYRLDEITGHHHRMFVDPTHAASPEYREFWRKLNSGEFIASSFRRIGKGGREVWLQASYNPIFDLGGKVMKVVKFANDITELTLLGSGLERLAANDVAHTIDVTFSPTYDNLRQDFNRAIGNLSTAMRGVAESAKMVASGATEIATVSDDLSRRTEQQAASLEETAAALDEVTATVRKTAEGAKHAKDVVAKARGDAEVSGEVVKRAVDAMGRIQKSSQQIDQIISVIDEIAFQTNLLALNAGVEAARAGEAGRGFAVVASEVRALAQRSAEAAKEIKALITSSRNEVDNGVKLVAETGESLERIVGRVTEINSVVADISAGATEQAAALGEVNTAVNQMDQTTQQNAAMAEQATAAGQSMSAEADRLTQAIEAFRLGDDGGDERMRSELKRAAPHAFASSAKPAPRSPHGAATETRPVRKAASGGRASSRATENWSEF